MNQPTNQNYNSYPTKRRLVLALEAAHRICGGTTPTTPTPNKPPPGLPAWCATTLAALTGAEGGGLAPLGYAEHKRLGEEVAAAYLTRSSGVSLRAHVTSKARTVQSCRAFREGAAGVWPPAATALACEDSAIESEGLLRPYAGCARLDAHRMAVMGAEEERAVGGDEKDV